jgi:ubiquinone/menaquinone biosynthesis C-methylase UbiE
MLARIVRFLRPVLVLLTVIIVLGVGITAYQVVRTVQQLTIVEAERDRWQRPNDIIHELNLNRNSTVVDLGCGSGYFALRLSRVVNSGGSVLAVDIRRLPLTFLWIRAVIHGAHNVRTILGDPEDSHLPPRGVNAVLIANTYHELDNPKAS